MSAWSLLGRFLWCSILDFWDILMMMILWPGYIVGMVDLEERTPPRRRKSLTHSLTGPTMRLPVWAIFELPRLAWPNQHHFYEVSKTCRIGYKHGKNSLGNI
jgi:hypothetical protein